MVTPSPPLPSVQPAQKSQLRTAIPSFLAALLVTQKPSRNRFIRNTRCHGSTASLLQDVRFASPFDVPFFGWRAAARSCARRPSRSDRQYGGLVSGRQWRETFWAVVPEHRWQFVRHHL